MYACSQDAGYGGGARQRMTLRDYVTWWRRYKAGKAQGLLYLKDWHFADEFPAYNVSNPDLPACNGDGSASMVLPRIASFPDTPSLQGSPAMTLLATQNKCNVLRTCTYMHSSSTGPSPYS